MASGGVEEDDGSIPLDIDNVHMLLQGQTISVLVQMLWHVMSYDGEACGQLYISWIYQLYIT